MLLCGGVIFLYRDARRPLEIDFTNSIGDKNRFSKREPCFLLLLNGLSTSKFLFVGTFLSLWLRCLFINIYNFIDGL